MTATLMHKLAMHIYHAMAADYFHETGSLILGGQALPNKWNGTISIA